jgi:5-hydroxyisourate hydrolase-like protein (transthyretin family)
MAGRILRLVLTLLALGAWASAASLTGTVTNKTTGKPAAGDTVALIKLGQGMEESASVKTDARGRFSVPLDDPSTPHLVRVTHQGVAYFQPAPPGSTSADVDVYDVVDHSIDGVGVTADVMSLQADSSTLQVTRLFVITNNSTPARTVMGDRPFEFYLPEGAQIDSGMAAAPGGMPLNKDPVPSSEKNRYYFAFPLRPGETRFQVAYHLPYSGQATLQPRTVSPLGHLVIMLPKSMQFRGTAGNFQTMSDKDADVHVVSSVEPGQQIAFEVSGTGATSRVPGGGAQGAAGSDSGGMGGGSADNRPGGGLGPPTETPDPLYQYRWQILIALGLVLTFGAFYILNRRPIAPALAKGAGGARVPAPVAEPEPELEPEPPAPRDRSARLLEALKEELFQLEMERHEGRISQAEYEKAKSALDQTIARAIARRKN